MAGFGLRIARSQGQEGFTGNTFEYPIDPTNTDKIFAGDPVILNAGGNLEEASGNTPGAVTVPIMGSFNGCRFVAANGDFEFERVWDGGAGRTMAVGSISMPAHSRFYVKGDSTVAYTQANVGSRHGLIYAAGNTQYGDSRVTLGAINAAGVAQLHGLAPLPGNEWSNAEPILEVSIVLQQGSASDAA